MNKWILYVAAMLSFVAFSARADGVGEGAQEFSKRISAYKKSCNKECLMPFAEFAADQALDAKTRQHLEAVAFDQAQVWGDTILEGDYHADGKTRLDSVSAIYQNQELVGYRIVYSERAWYTGDCEFDDNDHETLKDCQEGRIREASFVSSDLKNYFRDVDAYAEFK